MPTFTIFTGINGAGKSTLYNFLKSIGNSDLGVRICPDEILEANNGSWKSHYDLFNSGQITIEKINYCIAHKISFNWETTSIGRIGEKFIEVAKENGFDVHLNFIGVDNVEESIKRIQYRVQCGGHGVAEDLVRSRFEYQSKGLAKALPLVDKALLFNNRDTIQVAGSYFDTKLYVFDKNSSWMQELVSLLDHNTPNNNTLDNE